MTEKLNASQFPKMFYARHMQPGLAGYEKETILVDTDGVKALLATGVGKPVYIHHQKVDLENLQEKAAGYITESFYNELDGWGWFKFLAVDDEAHKVIAQGWSVSNAYRPTQWGSGGTKNNCPYDREVLNGEFTHLAIVPDPRYEGACIYTPDQFKAYQEEQKNKLAELQNSKQKGKTMFKLFKTKKEEVSGNEVDADTEIHLENGKTVKIGEMITALENGKTKKNEKEETENTADQVVQVGDEKMPLKELVNKYQKMNSEKKNADDEAAKKKEEEEKKNVEEEAKKKEEEKKNAASGSGDIENSVDPKFFEELSNANRVEFTKPQIITPSANMLQRGKSRYGSAN